MEDIQYLRDKVSEALWQLGEKELSEVCMYLKCDGLDRGEPCSRTRRSLINMVERVLNEKEETQEESEVSSLLTDTLSFVTKMGERAAQEQTVFEEPSQCKGLGEKYLQPSHTSSHTRYETEEHTRDSVDSKLHRPTLFSSRREQHAGLPEVTLRREFKIFGQIGESGQKDKLSYLSLIRQIEVGLDKGHSDTEIIEAVIRAITPGLPLRDMLEIKRGLTLNSLFTILKGHYKVDSATDLYHQLINISQDQRETALNFVFRAIELKDKLLWKATNGDLDVQYSRDTIQRKFLRSIETGLLSDSVKFQILPYLSDVRTSDEELIELVNEATKLEGERLEKRKRLTTARNPRVQELHTETQPARPAVQVSQPPKEASPAATAAAVRSMKGKENKVETLCTQEIIEELRTEMKQMFREAMAASSTPSWPRRCGRGCSKCQEEQNGDNCQHCFKCGREGHFSRGCRAPGGNNLSGNGQGLLRRDTQ